MLLLVYYYSTLPKILNHLNVPNPLKHLPFLGCRLIFITYTVLNDKFTKKNPIFVVILRFKIYSPNIHD